MCPFFSYWGLVFRIDRISVSHMPEAYAGYNRTLPVHISSPVVHSHVQLLRRFKLPGNYSRSQPQQNLHTQQVGFPLFIVFSIDLAFLRSNTTGGPKNPPPFPIPPQNAPFSVDIPKREDTNRQMFTHILSHALMHAWHPSAYYFSTWTPAPLARRRLCVNIGVREWGRCRGNTCQRRCSPHCLRLPVTNTHISHLPQFLYQLLLGLFLCVCVWKRVWVNYIRRVHECVLLSEICQFCSSTDWLVHS